jgi:hypothetical protein
MEYAAFPGGEMIERGLADLARGIRSAPALLVAIGEPRLRELGVAVPAHAHATPERALYDLIAETAGDAAHSQYNALVRRLVSFERARVRRLVDAARLRELMRELGRAADCAGGAYLVGGSTAVLVGWRQSTVTIDLKIEPESDHMLRAIAELKERLDLNLELAAPDQFIPELPGWRDRSPWIAREGKLDFHHYDPYAQALAKLERGHVQDRADVEAMIARELVAPRELLRRFEEIEPLLYRFPAIDPASFRRAVEAVAHASR